MELRTSNYRKSFALIFVGPHVGEHREVGLEVVDSRHHHARKSHLTLFFVLKLLELNIRVMFFIKIDFASFVTLT